MATCLLCSVLASDPEKGPSRWARAVIAGEQVLICPECQRATPDWIDRAEPCPACGSKRLSKSLGDRICRTCHYQSSDEVFTLD